MNTNLSNLVATGCRWIARIIGTLFVLVIVLLALGEGMPNVFTQPAHVQAGFLGLALIVSGLLMGWRWDLAAGITSLAGWLTFVVATGFPFGRRCGFLLALALPGLLYLASALFRQRRDRAC